MDETSAPLLPRLLVGAAVVFVALTVIGWVIGAILGFLKLLLVVAVAIGIIWAIVSSRSD